IISISSGTACWRGYIMKYLLTQNHLILDEMRVNAKQSKEINDIEPQTGDSLFKYHYKKLNLRSKFTGNILLAKDFIQSMYVHMGFQRPITFKTVIEIKVNDGNVISQMDLSRKMEELRSQDSNRGAQPPSNSQKDIEEWVKQTFSLDYDF
ncbi:hypothetical protein LCGC14_1931030, partial [marine sediment metagenome]